MRELRFTIDGAGWEVDADIAQRPDDGEDWRIALVYGGDENIPTLLHGRESVDRFGAPEHYITLALVAVECLDEPGAGNPRWKARYLEVGRREIR